MELCFTSRPFDCWTLLPWVLESVVIRPWTGVSIGGPPNSNKCALLLWVHSVFQIISPRLVWDVLLGVQRSRAPDVRGWGGCPGRWGRYTEFYSNSEPPLYPPRRGCCLPVGGGGGNPEFVHFSWASGLLLFWGLHRPSLPWSPNLRAILISWGSRGFLSHWLLFHSPSHALFAELDIPPPWVFRFWALSPCVVSSIPLCLCSHVSEVLKASTCIHSAAFDPNSCDQQPSHIGCSSPILQLKKLRTKRGHTTCWAKTPQVWMTPCVYFSSYTASLPAGGLQGLLNLLAGVVSPCLSHSPPVAGSHDRCPLGVMNKPQQDAEDRGASAGGAAHSARCVKSSKASLGCTEWPWFSMLMASHRQGEFPLEAADIHRGHQPSSHWEALGLKFYPMVGKRKKGESDGKVAWVFFFFFLFFLWQPQVSCTPLEQNFCFD